MHFLSLPHELFIYGIFPYLHSADLVCTIATLDNGRLRSLVYAYIRHLDLTGGIDFMDELPQCHWNAIRSLRIKEENLRNELFSNFSMLDRLDVQMSSSTTQSILPHYFMHLIQLKTLHLFFTPSERPFTDRRFASFIWQPDSRVQHLSVSNCIILDQSHFSVSSQLVANECLTRLSLDVADLTHTLPLLLLAPALEYFDVRLHHSSSTPLRQGMKALEGREWPRRVKSLRLLAHDCFLRTGDLCAYIRLFAASLERLPFYVQLPECYLMQRRCFFERYLLNYLSRLKQLHFCVHSGFASIDPDYRRTFDRWIHHHHVISIFHAGTHTRFTLPFVFDRLEQITNDFVDYHSNEYRSDFVLMLPSITTISFHAAEPLTLRLFTLIQGACPRLRRMEFKRFCQFDDDLTRDTQLTIPNVKQLYLDYISLVSSDVSFDRLFRLTPNLEYMTVDGQNLPTILHLVVRRRRPFDTIRHLIISSKSHCSITNRADVAKQFPNASVIYQAKCQDN